MASTIKMGNHQKNLTVIKNGKFLGFTFVVLACAMILSGLAFADPVITQGYDVNQTLPEGAIVSIKNGDNSSVEAATLKNSNSLFGVVIEGNNAQVSLTTGSKQVQVATNGLNQVLVTDMNGKISSGDEITASPLAGVGMLATQNAEIIGTAQGNFPNNTAKKEKIKGSSQEVNIGNIPLLVSVGYFTKQPNKTILPAAIQNLANALAGKQVKSLPVLISMGIFLVTIVVVVSIVYSIIHGSIISVGRNPMSQAAVYRNVIQLSSLVVGILGVSMFAIYMILTRVS